MKKVRFAQSIAAMLVLALWVPDAHSEDSFLRPKDVILTVGDSITAQGVYQAQMQQVIDTIYPHAGIRIVNAGSGGMNAGGGVAVIAERMKKEKPTIVTVMFGVNDTFWSPAGADKKAKAFVEHMGRIIEVARKNDIALIILRETHFSHNSSVEPWVAQMNELLEHLLRAQDKLAAAREVPVVDVLAAYRQSLKAAWQKDPAYQFTPDVIHPTSPGHAVIATELMRALGVGLPLADSRRGRLHLSRRKGLRFATVDGHGILRAEERLRVQVRCRNQSPRRSHGKLTLVAGGYRQSKTLDVAAGASETARFAIPAKELQGRWNCIPLYLVFVGDEHFTADHSLFYYSKCAQIDQTALAATGADFHAADGNGKSACPLSRLQVSRKDDRLRIGLHWTDKTPVYGRGGFRNRFGKQITTPLDLAARAGQPCDAVEFFFDLRPDESTGRFTSSADANPKGVYRVGLYRVKEAGKIVTKVQTSAADKPDAAAVRLVRLSKSAGGGQLLELRVQPAGHTVGFSVRVTDRQKFSTDDGKPFQLTGKPHLSLEPMSFIRFARESDVLFYRIGY